jgi:hypothetical protein
MIADTIDQLRRRRAHLLRRRLAANATERLSVPNRVNKNQARVAPLKPSALPHPEHHLD